MKVQELHSNVRQLISTDILTEFMTVCPIPDIELERLFTTIRHNLLLSLQEDSFPQETLPFLTALACQCFINEYLYNETEEEAKALKAMETIVKQDLEEGKQPSPQVVLLLASYSPLNNYEWHGLLHTTRAINEVYIRQVQEPKKERIIAGEIRRFKKPRDKISLEVRKQYEENPYPRWSTIGLNSNPKTLKEIFARLHLRFSDVASIDLNTPDILVAGCGTGQHSIGVSTRYKNCNVLGIDLSVSSLAYAKRKSDELGIRNIEYMQADILSLGELDRKFDIIECAGVLHHMQNPKAGWQSLISCLKPGGLMKIGLYSESSRQHIKEIRREIAELGNINRPKQIKTFRNNLICSKEAHHKEILTSPDFYSLSALRDLLFHVQEHRFTIPQIERHLHDLGLSFCGFENDRANLLFQKKNTQPNAIYNLRNWDLFEKENPRIFIGMYQFWCQKI